MEATQRFTAARPCPICGGHKGIPQHKGKRCYGFSTDEGAVAFCTREEFAGSLRLNPNSNGFPHRLRGVCDCGVEHSIGRAALTYTRPRADEDAPSVDTYVDMKLGRPTKVWPYRYANGALAGYAARWDLAGGEKEIRPLTQDGNRWVQKGIPNPRPLYQLPELLRRRDSPVIVVEGEKSCDAARDLFPSYIVVTSMHGGGSAHLTDWSPVRSRSITIWPDNDVAGLHYAQAVADLALENGATEVKIVDLPEELPEHWDLADALPEGLDLECLFTNAKAVVAYDEDLDVRERRPSRVSPSDQLLRLALERSVLYTDGEEAYADVQVEGRSETFPVRARGFRQWLRALYFDNTNRGVTSDALVHCVETIDALASRSRQRRVSLRVASLEGRLYLDLCNQRRSVVGATQMGGES